MSKVIINEKEIKLGIDKSRIEKREVNDNTIDLTEIIRYVNEHKGKKN